MFSLLETITIIGIIIVQLIITARAYRQIDQIKSFLPKGRSSLLLKEYAIPADKIQELEPSQVVDKIAYTPSKVEDVEKVNEERLSITQPRDEKGRFISKRTVFSPVHGDIELDEEEGIYPY